jgi:hypothetical protein
MNAHDIVWFDPWFADDQPSSPSHVCVSAVGVVVSVSACASPFVERPQARDTAEADEIQVAAVATLLATATG